MGNCGTEDKSITVLLPPVQFNTVQLNPVQLCPVQFRAVVGFHIKPFQNTCASHHGSAGKCVRSERARARKSEETAPQAPKIVKIGAAGAEIFEKCTLETSIFKASESGPSLSQTA